MRRCSLQSHQQQRKATGAVRAEPRLQQAEQAAPQPQRASDAELRADGLLMLAAAVAPLLMDVEPAAAGNPLLTGKTVSALYSSRIPAWQVLSGLPMRRL